ncbi:MAG: hypothetical protein KC620_06605, partial [Myxococcales bacterium]|nr:hypothetical protein [Myxococcales bacterium]
FKGTLLQAVDNLRSRERSNVGDRPGAGPASEESDDVGDEDAVDVEVQPVAGRPPSKAPGGFVIPELQVGGGADDDGTVQRWLMDKDGVDYGPFTSKQIVEKLFKEEISAETVIFDIETDRRQSLSEFGVFEDALLAWIHEKDKREKHRAEEAEAAAGRRRLMVLLGVIVAVVVVVGGSLGGWFLYQSSLPTPVKAHLASLVTPMRGGLPVVNLPEELPETVAEIRARRQKEAAERMARASAAERARLMEEERLAAQTEMVDVGAANTGGGGPFDRGAFDRVVASRQAQMVKCLQDEVRRDPGLKSLEVQITVIPRGDLVAVKMPAGSPRGQACVRSALRGLKVPPFQGTNYKIKLPYQFQ